MPAEKIVITEDAYQVMGRYFDNEDIYCETFRGEGAHNNARIHLSTLAASPKFSFLQLRRFKAPPENRELKYEPSKTLANEQVEQIA